MSRSFSYRQFAEDVATLLDQLGIERIAIVGWSDGAITGLELAMAKPDRVSKLFAFGASMSRSCSETRASRRSNVTGWPHASADAGRQTTGPRGGWAALVGMQGGM